MEVYLVSDTVYPKPEFPNTIMGMYNKCQTTVARHCREVSKTSIQKGCLEIKYYIANPYSPIN